MKVQTPINRGGKGERANCSHGLNPVLSLQKSNRSLSSVEQGFLPFDDYKWYRKSQVGLKVQRNSRCLRFCSFLSFRFGDGQRCTSSVAFP